MSADIAIFHSSEADDITRLRGEGWYIGTFQGDTLTTDDAKGPYATEQEAQNAIAKGAWR